MHQEKVNKGRPYEVSSQRPLPGSRNIFLPLIEGAFAQFQASSPDQTDATPSSIMTTSHSSASFKPAALYRPAQHTGKLEKRGALCVSSQ